MAAPLDRIRQALKDAEQVARFDRALAALADLLVPALTSNANVTPVFEPRIHDGHLIDVGLTVKQTIR